jgi:hypothetical protein
MVWAWLLARMKEKKNAYRIFVGKPEGSPPRRAIKIYDEQEEA